MSNLDYVSEVALTLERLVPPENGAGGDWDDVVARLGRRDPLVGGRRGHHRHVRLAIVVALLFLLLTGVAMATYLLVRGNGSLAVEGRQLLLVNPHGQRAVARCPANSSGCQILAAAWSPDGAQIAYLRAQYFGHKPTRTVLYVAAADGSRRERLASCGLCGVQWGGRLGWSPDGRWIAFSRDSGSRGQESLWLVAAAGGRLHRLTKCHAWCADVQPTWALDGEGLVFERIGPKPTISGLYTVSSDGSGLTRIAPNGTDPRWSPDGRRIVFDSGPNAISVVNADGSDRRVLYSGAPGTGPGVPSWSPDGRKLVFFNTPGTPGHFAAEIWTMNADGSDKKRLYRSGCCVSEWAPPVWSPDGRQIAFSADSSGGTYVINADGTGLRRVSSSPSNSLSWQDGPKR